MLARTTRDQYRTVGNGHNEPLQITRRVGVANNGGSLQIRAQIWDADSGVGSLDADDPIADWTLSWDNAQIRAAQRDANGTIHSGIGIRNNKCSVSLWYNIDSAM